jgi:hypothetical protein
MRGAEITTLTLEGMPMQSGITLQLVWSDDDMWEVRVSAANRQFSGTAQFYEQKGDLIAAAAKLEGFPKREIEGDTREIELGFLGVDRTFGGVRFKFYTRGFVRHMYVELSLDSNKNDFGQVQSVLLRGAVEAAAIDNFVSDLKTVEDKLGGEAFLRIEDSNDQH